VTAADSVGILALHLPSSYAGPPGKAAGARPVDPSRMACRSARRRCGMRTREDGRSGSRAGRWTGRASPAAVSARCASALVMPISSINTATMTWSARHRPISRRAEHTPATCSPASSPASFSDQVAMVASPNAPLGGTGLPGLVSASADCPATPTSVTHGGMNDPRGVISAQARPQV